MAPSSRRSSALAWPPSRARLWSLWPASTTASKCSLRRPPGPALSSHTPVDAVPGGTRRNAVTRVCSRVSASCATSRCTYSRDPPCTVNHCGRPVTRISPWLWQNRIIVATGNCSIWSVGQLQMQPSIGSRYQSRNALENRCWRRKSAIGCCIAPSASCSAMRVVSRLKRSRSRNMPRKRGRSRLRRWANTVSRLQPLHSRLPPGTPPGTCTENDISDAAVGTARSSNSLTSPG